MSSGKSAQICIWPKMTFCRGWNWLMIWFHQINWCQNNIFVSIIYDPLILYYFHLPNLKIAARVRIHSYLSCGDANNNNEQISGRKKNQRFSVVFNSLFCGDSCSSTKDKLLCVIINEEKWQYNWPNGKEIRLNHKVAILVSMRYACLCVYLPFHSFASPPVANANLRCYFLFCSNNNRRFMVQQ